jgi:hypothetical protein
MTRATSTAIFVQISGYTIAIHDVTFSRPILVVDIFPLAILQKVITKATVHLKLVPPLQY